MQQKYKMQISKVILSFISLSNKSSLVTKAGLYIMYNFTVPEGDFLPTYLAFYNVLYLSLLLYHGLNCALNWIITKTVTYGHTVKTHKTWIEIRNRAIPTELRLCLLKY